MLVNKINKLNKTINKKRKKKEIGPEQKMGVQESEFWAQKQGGPFDFVNPVRCFD